MKSNNSHPHTRRRAGRITAFIAAAGILAMPAALGISSLPAIAVPEHHLSEPISASTQSTTGTSTATPTEESKTRSVKNATFTWSVNQESTGGSYFGGCNFLVAGKAVDAGSSKVWNKDVYTQLTQPDADGNSVAGNVSVHKSDGKPTNYDNKCKTAAGVAVNGKTSATAADNHTGDYVQITGGEGKINTETNSGVIEWKGSWTFVYYGGMTYWTITNPKMIIANGKGSFTGTYSGVGADMDDPSIWIPELKKKTDRIIDLNKTTVDLGKTTAAGQSATITATPDYRGVKTKLSGRNPQADKNNENASWWGSFPDPWVEFNQLTNQDSYWFTSAGGAGSIQPRKVTDHFTISYQDAGSALNSDMPTPPPVTPAPRPSPDANPATLFWGINEESASGAFYGGCNFLVAGAAGDNKGAFVWNKGTSFYRTKVGNVTIEKPNSKGQFKQATWNSKCQDRNGGTVATTKKNSQTENRLNIKKGVTKDSSGTITVQWSGAVTVAFYGGMTYWSFSDPTLTVDSSGKGSLTATASGYGTDMDNMDKWEKLTPEKITLANFSGVDVKKARSDGGFSVTPDYKGVKVDAQGGRSPQDRSVKDWGAFPQSFVDFNIKTGQSAYWYTSGLSRDFAKPAAPLTVALKEGYTPGSSDYNGQSGDSSARNNNPNAGANSNAGGSSNSAASAPEQATPPKGNGDDASAFAPVAQDARTEAAAQALSTQQMWGAGAIGAGTVSLAVGTGWWLRRRIGLDPHTWN